MIGCHLWKRRLVQHRRVTYRPIGTGKSAWRQESRQSKLSTIPVIDHRRNPDIDRQKPLIKSTVRSPSHGSRGHQPASRGLPQQPGRPQSRHHAGAPQNSKTCGKVPVCHPSHPAANAHTEPRVTFGLVLLCRKTHLATYMQLGKALSLRVEDIGRATASHATALWPAVAGSFGLQRERRIASPLSGTTLYPCHKITNTSPRVAYRGFQPFCVTTSGFAIGVDRTRISCGAWWCHRTACGFP